MARQLLRPSTLGILIEREMVQYLERLAVMDPEQKRGKPPKLELEQEKAAFLGMAPGTWGKLRAGKTSLTMDTAINIANRFYDDAEARARCVRRLLQADPFRVQATNAVDDPNIHPALCEGASLYSPFHGLMTPPALLVLYGFLRFDDYLEDPVLKNLLQMVERGGHIALVDPYPPTAPVPEGVEITRAHIEQARASEAMKHLYDKLIERLRGTKADFWGPVQTVRLYHRPMHDIAGLTTGNHWFMDYPLDKLQRRTTVWEWRHLPDRRSAFIEQQERVTALHRDGLSRWIFLYWREHFKLPPTDSPRPA